jgi:hypothetical protein
MAMKRAILAVLVGIGSAATAHADVTVKQTTAGKGLGMGGTFQTTMYIKGMKMRSDAVNGDTTRTTIFDVENQKMYIFDSKKKEADVWDMAAFGAEVGKSVDTSEMHASFKPNGQTKQVGGKAANGYDMEISVPTTMGGSGGMKMIVTLKGPAWVVKGAPGTEDYMRFYKGAVEKGWIFTDPRAAKGQPGQAKAMAEMYKQLAASGGVPYEQEMEIKLSGDGPMAAMMAKMGGMSMTTTVESVDTAAVAADLFAPPPGYKLNQKK